MKNDTDGSCHKKWNSLLEMRVDDVLFVHKVLQSLNKGEMNTFEKHCVGLDTSEQVHKSLIGAMDMEKVGIVGHRLASFVHFILHA